MSKGDNIDSVRFMQLMRRLLAGGSRIEFGERSAEDEARLKALSLLDDPAFQLSEQGGELFLQSLATDLQSAMPIDVRLKVGNIPLALIGREAQQAAIWQHQNRSARFIGIDYGLLKTIYAITTITIHAARLLADSRPIDDAANVLKEVFTAHYTNKMLNRPVHSELKMESWEKAISMLLVAVQEMFIIAHEYGHHVLGHLGSRRPTIKDNFEEELDRAENFDDVLGMFTAANTPIQLQEMAADRFAFEMLFNFCNRPRGLLRGLAVDGTAAFPFLLAGFSCYEFVVRGCLVRGEREIKLFVVRQCAGTHPPALVRRDAFFRDFDSRLDKDGFGYSYYRMYLSTLAQMLRMLVGR